MMMIRFTHKLFMFSSVGWCKMRRFQIHRRLHRFVLVLALSVTAIQLILPKRATASDEAIERNSLVTDWKKFSKEAAIQKALDERNGISYIISGSLALVGGIWGASIATDSFEKGTYTIFQSIGVASIGYGIYTWQIGSEERTLYDTLASAKLSAKDKSIFLKAYREQRAGRERRERLIRAITHGLIAGVNFYNAGEQTNDSVRTALYFIGSVNLLAAITFSFEF